MKDLRAGEVQSKRRRSIRALTFLGMDEKNVLHSWWLSCTVLLAKDNILDQDLGTFFFSYLCSQSWSQIIWKYWHAQPRAIKWAHSAHCLIITTALTPISTESHLSSRQLIWHKLWNANQGARNHFVTLQLISRYGLPPAITLERMWGRYIPLWVS